MWYLRIMIAMLALGATASAQQSMNMAAFKQEARVFERVVGEVLRQDFTHPFALEAEPMTSYLQGYGVVVTFHLKINRPVFQGISGEESSESPRKDKAKQIRLVRERMIQCLADFGASLRQLGSNESIAVSAHIEDRSEFNPGNKKTVLTLSVLKDDIDLLAARQMSEAEFRDKVRVLKY